MCAPPEGHRAVYDETRKIYYVSMDLGKDKDGKRVKRYQTYRTLYAARMGLRDFLTHREQELPRGGSTRSIGDVSSLS